MILEGKNRRLSYYYDKFKVLKPRTTSGIVFIYDGKILLLHPANEKWKKSFSYPKGGIDEGENEMMTALRETQEEIGVRVPSYLLTSKHRIVNSDDEFGGVVKIDYYYLIYLDDYLFDRLFNSNLIIKYSKLQHKEIDWAGFIDSEKARNLIKPRLKRVLRHLT